MSEGRDPFAPLDAEFVADRINTLVAGEPKEFAYRTRISLSAVYNYLGGRTPAIDILVRIALVYKRDLSWFFSEFQPDQRQDEFVERRLELVRQRPRQQVA